MKPILVFFLLALAAYGQQQKRVAVINTVDDRDSIGVSELIHLTDRLREKAANVLPKQSYGVMTTESIVDFLGSQERAEKECREASCLAELGRKVNADYVAQARIGRFESDLTIKVELYNSGSGVMIGSFTGDSKHLPGLRSIIDENAPILFRKLPGASGGALSPIIAGGIGGVQTSGGDYEFEGGKRYLAYLNTEPSGAILSFNGVPIASCTKTPCKAELREGSVRIIAALEQYQTADTTVLVTHNNQSISMALKANFGVLEIKPAYSDNIGSYNEWFFTINNKAQSSYENRLSPGNYEVKLSHECYEDISFKAGINKGKREVFNIANSMKLKKGGLDLSAEADGEPVSEPVYVNGKLVGETPFSGSVPICAKIEIGSDRETVKVNIKHNAAKTYTHQMDTEEIRRRQEERRQAKFQEEMEEARKEAARTAWMAGFGFGGGVSLNMNEVDPYYFKSLGGQFYLSLDFYKRNLKFFRYGMSIDFGSTGIEKDYIRKMHPTALIDDTLDIINVKTSATLRLYPVDFLFLSGGGGYAWYNVWTQKPKPDNSYELEKLDVVSISTPVLLVGGGICFCFTDEKNNSDLGIIIEGLYNIVPFKGRTAKYITINAGFILYGITRSENDRRNGY